MFTDLMEFESIQPGAFSKLACLRTMYVWMCFTFSTKQNKMRTQNLIYQKKNLWHKWTVISQNIYDFMQGHRYLKKKTPLVLNFHLKTKEIGMDGKAFPRKYINTCTQKKGKKHFRFSFVSQFSYRD